MKLDELKILYVCNDFPFPPMHGGLVDMWNRVKALHSLGVQLDVIATVKEMPSADSLKTVQEQVRSLRLIKRKPLSSGLFTWRPVQVAIRNELRFMQINKKYNFLLMQSEFVTEILRNRTIEWETSIIRVDNNECSYNIRTAKAEHSLIRKLYYLQEALRMKWHSKVAFKNVDVLWFISHEEMEGYDKSFETHSTARSLFMPSSVDLDLMDRPSLEGKKVLFVGSLWNPLNRAALEWYISSVHPKLADLVDYKLLIAGSTRGKTYEWLTGIVSSFSNIEIKIDVDDLSPIYRECALFINPMQSGAGVKLKTVEAGVRGLPILSTGVGAEGTGFVSDVHFKLATSPEEFCCGVRDLLENQDMATAMVDRCQVFLLENYNQKNALKRALRI